MRGGSSIDFLNFLPINGQQEQIFFHLSLRCEAQQSGGAIETLDL
jgi:hypothetical protein